MPAADGQSGGIPGLVPINAHGAVEPNISGTHLTLEFLSKIIGA
jgi:hypothetical protein